MTDRPAPTYHQRAGVNATPLPGGDLVLLCLTTQRYYTLNGTGRAVWSRLAEPQTVEDLARGLTERYAVGAAAARSSTQRLLDDLVREGLVVPTAD